MQKSKEYTVPIPRDHFAKMIDRSWAWIRVLIDRGRLPALELVQDDKTLESIMIPYTSKTAKQQSLFIAPNVAVAYKDALKKRAARPKNVKGPRGAFPRILKLPQEHNSVVVPVPLHHLARKAGLTVGALSAAIYRKDLAAVEFIFDEELLESKLVPYIPQIGINRRDPLYVMPDEAQRFVIEEQRKRDEIQREIKVEPDFITVELEQQILEAAQFIKQQDPRGIVERTKVLEVVSGGKRNNMYLAKKIRYILDQHIDEFPPHHSGPHAFLAKQGKTKKSKE